MIEAPFDQDEVLGCYHAHVIENEPIDFSDTVMVANVLRGMMEVASQRPSSDLLRALFSNAGQHCRTATGRWLLRRLAPEFSNMEALLCHADISAQMPDLALWLTVQRRDKVNIDELLRTEQAYMRRNDLIPHFPEAVLDIAFFGGVNSFYSQFSYDLVRERNKQTWVVPPVSLSFEHRPYVSQETFLRRLTRFVGVDIANMFCHMPNCFISGAILPMCALRHGWRIDEEEEFFRCASGRWQASCDVFVIGGDAMDEIRRYVDTIPFRLTRKPLDWNETDREYSRKGRTFYLVSEENGKSCPMQIIAMPDEQTALGVCIRNHFPCVRCWYDMHGLHVTPSCLVSWITRFVDAPPFFGNNTSLERKRRFYVKYAMRGFGFGKEAMNGVTFPPEIMEWIDAWGRNRPLPWYSPLYNPEIWSQQYTQAQIDAIRNG